MTSQRQYISKGVYEYPQISDFVSVKEYIFIRHNDKKCLALRFFNELGYVVNTLEFSVVQMDASGKILETSKIKCKGLNFRPGTTYVDSSTLVVNEYCADFRVVFTEVVSERYKYTVRNGRVTVDYIKNSGKIIKNGRRSDPITEFSIKPKSFGKPRLAVLLAGVVAFLLVLLCAFDVVFSYDFFGLGNNKNKADFSACSGSFEELEITPENWAV